MFSCFLCISLRFYCHCVTQSLLLALFILFTPSFSPGIHWSCGLSYQSQLMII